MEHDMILIRELYDLICKSQYKSVLLFTEVKSY